MDRHVDDLAGPGAHAPRAAAVVLAVVLFGLLATASPVNAHTAFVGSDPADGSVVTEPVDEIVIEFTGVSTPAGDGFVVLDPDGRERTPTTVTTDDDKVFRLAFDPPLAGGAVGVRWSVRAGDAHPTEGSFSFTVDAVVTPVSDDTDELTVAGDGDGTLATSTSALDEFLHVDGRTPGETGARVGRLVSFGAVVLAVGALGFAASTLRGSPTEVGRFVRTIRLVALAMTVGALVEYVGVTRLLDENWWSTWSTSPGAATVFRGAAGLAIALGLAPTVAPVRRPHALSAAPATTLDVETTGAGSVVRWVPGTTSRLAFVGVALAIVSFWFDGHTVTKGWRVLHALANSVHVVAGSIWVGGVVSMAVVLWRRHRADRPSDALGLVVRFSSVAALALAGVVAAGVVMAFAILDTFGELTSTEWGQVLLLKTAAAAVAMGIGGYNHFVLRPALEEHPGDSGLQRSIRSTVTAEAIVLAFVVAVTAWLVAAAS